jgi:serine/threonine protein kinase
MIGKTISHYNILEKLGEGGMGMVYKAFDTKLEREVALKVLRHEAIGDPAAKERFIREARAASALNHPNITTIYEIDEWHGQDFICMEYVEGETVKKKIQSGQMSMDEVLNIAIQTAEGLQEAHEHDIIHRDIKSENIMVTPKGLVKVMDFGIAKLRGTSGLTKNGTTMGTISYISPEQAKNQDADHRSDIWSFGVVLYEMITGQLPFQGEYDQVVLYSIMNEEPAPMTGLRIGVPLELERLVKKALAKNPDERYEHIENMLEDLNAGKIQPGTERSKKISNSKNIIRSKLLYLFAGLIIIITTGLILKTTFLSNKIDSIAVLPFQDFSKNVEQEYFTDGMTDALITELSKISALRVISRTSVMQYKKDPKSLAQIAKELNVDAVVEGSVLREGDKVQITARLIKTMPEKLLWADEDERDLRDVLILQKEVAKAITSEIKIALTPSEEADLAITKIVNPEAFELYLQGRYLMSNSGTPASIQKSINYFLKALEIDSSYALAYAGFAEAYTLFGNYAMLPPNEALPNAKRYAIKALEIDETLVEAHTTLGYIKMIFDWDWTGAEGSIKRAIRLNPGYGYAYTLYAWYTAVMGRFEESIAHAKQALDLDPLSVGEKAFLGERLFEAGRYDEAVAQLKKAMNDDASFYYAHWILGFVYEQKKMYVEAITEFKKAVEYSEEWSTCIASLGHAYAISGKTNDAYGLLNELKELSKNQYISSYDIATIYVGLSEFDEAMTWLEKAFEQRDGYLGGWINIDPRLDVLKSDERFIDLLKKIGFEK